jgi:hypothetical protein
LPKLMNVWCQGLWTDILALEEKLFIICKMCCWSVTNNWSVQISLLSQKSSYSSKLIYVVLGQMLPPEHSAWNGIQEHWHLNQLQFATVKQFTCVVELSTSIIFCLGRITRSAIADSSTPNANMVVTPWTLTEQYLHGNVTKSSYNKYCPSWLLSLALYSCIYIILIITLWIYNGSFH